MRQPFPLQWPTGWARTDPSKRERALFRVTLTEGVQDLLYDLRLMGAVNAVITSDLPTNTKGLPYASGKAEDPGIAVWVVVGGSERVFACDRWSTAAANLRAIGKTVEAIRKIGDWGAADMVTRAFSGFAALPPGDAAEDWRGRHLADCPALTRHPTAACTCRKMTPNQASTKRPWRDVLGYRRQHDESPNIVLLQWARTAHRNAIRTAHPDVGGSHERAAELNVALQEAEAELGGV